MANEVLMLLVPIHANGQMGRANVYDETGSPIASDIDLKQGLAVVEKEPFKIAVICLTVDKNARINNKIPYSEKLEQLSKDKRVKLVLTNSNDTFGANPRADAPFIKSMLVKGEKPSTIFKFHNSWKVLTGDDGDKAIKVLIEAVKKKTKATKRKSYSSITAGKNDVRVTFSHREAILEYTLENVVNRPKVKYGHLVSYFLQKNFVFKPYTTPIAAIAHYLGGITVDDYTVVVPKVNAPARGEDVVVSDLKPFTKIFWFTPRTAIVSEDYISEQFNAVAERMPLVYSTCILPGIMSVSVERDPSSLYELYTNCGNDAGAVTTIDETLVVPGGRMIPVAMQNLKGQMVLTLQDLFYVRMMGYDYESIENGMGLYLEKLLQ